MVDFVDINGARLAYRIIGSQDAPLMITLHGGRGQGDHRTDFSVYGQLNDRLRVLSFDYRGHGQSSRTKPYTFDQIVDDIESIRQHFSKTPDDKVIICGGSFGGFLALHYAIKYPSHLSHLILRGTAASHHHEQGAIETLSQRAARAPSFSEKMLINKIFSDELESDEEFRLISFAMAPLYKDIGFDPDEALRSCLGNIYVAESHNDLYSEEEKYFDYTSDLDKITARTLVIVGSNDWICPPSNSEIIAEGIRDARLVIIEGANHSVHVEKTPEVLAHIRQHLSFAEI